MLFVILSLIFVACIFMPQLWVKYTFMKYSKERDEMPGTGGELAAHLIKRFKLTDTKLETTDEGKDHFDPSSNTVRLSPSHFDKKSLTAISVAAHEVGHALQHHRQETVSQLRARYIPLAMHLQKCGTFLLIITPIVGIIVKAPVIITLTIVFSLLLQLLSALTYLIILPEEWDASFNKALPILTEGQYIPEQHLVAVRKILKAAALTYFCAALANVLNVGRWFMLLRR